MAKPSLIWTDIDYGRDGKQVGWLHLPHSVTRSAYGTIAIPIAVVKNGAGPTVLLTAGNHGDEWEGQVTLMKLARVFQLNQPRAGLDLVVPPKSSLCWQLESYMRCTMTAFFESPMVRLFIDRDILGAIVPVPLLVVASIVHFS